MSNNDTWAAPLAVYDAALAKGGSPFHQGLTHGTMTLELYRPVGADHQTPHQQDEIYIIHTGTSKFRRGDDVVVVGPGDTLFVPAHMPHRFEDFSEDFCTWVVFWGPEGGECRGGEQTHADRPQTTL